MKTVDIVYRYGARDSRPLPSDSDSALLRLNHGNRDFAALLDHVNDETGVQRIVPVDLRDLVAVSDGTGAPKQTPFAAILGCSDARVPIELIFNEGPNELFVVRVAGNGLGAEVLGSLKYAMEHLDGTLKLIAVLGHSGCGALTAAVDVFLNPSDYLALVANHSLRGILDRSLLVIQASASKLASVYGSEVVRSPGYRQALIEASIVINSALAAYAIQQEFVAKGLAEMRAAYGVYILETREVWAPRHDNVNGIGLAAVPPDLAGFIDLGSAVAQSERIASFIRLP